MSALLEVNIHPSYWTELDFDKIHLEINQEIHNAYGINAIEYSVDDPAEVHDLSNAIIDKHLKGSNTHTDLYFVILQDDKTLYEMYVQQNAEQGFPNVYLVDVVAGLIYLKLSNHLAYSARDKKGDSLFSIPVTLLKDLSLATDESLNAFVQQNNRDHDYVALTEFIDCRTSPCERRLLETTEEWLQRSIQRTGHFDLINTLFKNLERSIAPEGIWFEHITLPETFKTDADVLGMFNSENIYVGNTNVPLVNVIKYIKMFKPDIMDVLAKYAVAAHDLAKERNRINVKISDFKEVSINDVFKDTDFEYKIRFKTSKPMFERISTDEKMTNVHLISYKLNNGTDVQVNFQTHIGSTAPFVNAELFFQLSDMPTVNGGGSIVCHATDEKGVLVLADLQTRLQDCGVPGLDKILENVLNSATTLLIEKGYATAF